MTIDLMPYLILWAIVTTAVVILALWRLVLGLHEMGGIHIASGGERELQQEAELSRREARIELWGKTLTVVSATLILGIGVAWVYNGLAR